MHPMLNIAIRAARAAGKEISLNFEDHENISVEQKAKNDLVTNIDKICEKRITDVILKSYPDHCVKGEEFGIMGNKDSDFVWIIDPIDGTTNFYKGIPHVAVSIGLRIKNVTTVAVIFDPIRNELFTAAKGDGAQLNGKKIRVGQAKSLDGTILATSFPHRNRDLLDYYKNILGKVFDQCADIRRAGTASLDLAYVASGRLDGYFELCLKPWDFCAGELLCREAGAVVTDFEGGSDYYQNGNIVCGNVNVVPKLLKEIKSCANK
jgi:myo-inositol-1(or 4)-monophosphatase